MSVTAPPAVPDEFQPTYCPLCEDPARVGVGQAIPVAAADQGRGAGAVGDSDVGKRLVAAAGDGAGPGQWSPGEDHAAVAGAGVVANLVVVGDTRGGSSPRFATHDGDPPVAATAFELGDFTFS